MNRKTEKKIMKKGFLSMVAALFVLLVSASFAQAAANPYVSASAGLGILTNSDGEIGDTEYNDVFDYKSGFVVNGALGLDGDMYRVEGAVGYQVNDIDKHLEEEVPDDADAEVSILSFMANGYVDLEMDSAPVTPYVMAGLGIASVDFDVDGNSEDESVFAYQFGAGVGIQATPNVMVDLGYRYFATSDVEIPAHDDSAELDIDSHNFMAGVRVAL
ncbi:MAG: outer membrane protein [Prosthecochloris sp.]|nr:outer membrane protein [Prosthecochloris sp.]